MSELEWIWLGVGLLWVAFFGYGGWAIIQTINEQYAPGSKERNND